MSRRQKWSAVLIVLLLAVIMLGALEGARLIEYDGSLYSAITAGDRLSVVLMIVGGADPNAPLPGGGNTAYLDIASMNGDEAMVKTLLRLGADPNSVNQVGYTPLSYGATSGNPAVVEALLAYGAEPTLLDMVFLEDTAGLRLEIEANPEQLESE